MNQIIVALDAMDLHVALELARNLTGKVWGFKINDLLVEYGTSLITTLRGHGHVFADPKLHDIPKTVFNSTRRLASAGANFITVHATGGFEMCVAAMAGAGTMSQILGVTMLTSLSEDEVRETYRGYPLRRFSEVLLKSGVPGVVCAGKEVPYWNLLNFIKVVPGVRPAGLLPGDDQKRTCASVDADYIVVGRPITEAEDPIEALNQIKEKLCNSTPTKNEKSLISCSVM